MCSLFSKLILTVGSSGSTHFPKRSCLQNIRIQPRGVPLSWLGTPHAGHDFLAKLQRVQPLPGIRFELMQDRVYRYGYWGDRIKQDWLNAIVSASGWWVDGEVQEEGGEAVVPIPEDDEDFPVAERLRSHWAQQL